MGNRISIQFQHGSDKSVVLFSHWQGEDLLENAKDYVKALKDEINTSGKGISNPIDRLEPATVIVDFIRHITKGEERIKSDLYLAKDESEGDNSDNGHHIIEL